MNKQQFFIGLIAVFVFFSCTGQDKNVLSPKDFKTKMSQPPVTVLDVRTPGEYKQGHLENATNIDYNSDQFETQSGKLDKAKPVLIYCLSGMRSERAAKILRQKGFKVQELNGGIEAWQDAGLPVVK